MSILDVFDNIVWPMLMQQAHAREESLHRLGQELLTTIGFRDDSEYPLDLDAMFASVE